MGDDVPSGAGSEQPEGRARQQDDESLKNAMAALLGLGPERGRGASSPSIPPPRLPEPRPHAAENPLSAAFGSPDASADDFWSASEPAPLPGEDPVPEAPPPVLDPPAPLLHPPDPVVDGPAPRLDPPPPLLHPPDPVVDGPAPRLDPPPPLLDAGAPRAAVREGGPRALSEPSAGEFWVSPDSLSPPDAPGAIDSVAVDPSRSSDDERSAATALQDAGLAGPLNTAMGDLRRLYPDGDDDGSPPPVLPTIDVPSARPPARQRRPRVQAGWESRGRELVPAAVVALLVVLAFAVVLTGRGGDDEGSRVDAANRSTTLPPTTASTMPTGAGEPTPLVPPLEEPLPVDPTESPPPSPPSASGRADADQPAPVAARSRPRARAPQAATPSSAPPPRAAPPPAPTSPPPTPAATAPPATSAPPTTQPPRSSDPCDNPLFTPEARQRCLDSRGGDRED